MKRREFIVGLGSEAAWPVAARAQQPAMPVVGYLSGRSSESEVAMLVAFRRGLGEARYVEGRNVAIDYLARRAGRSGCAGLPTGPTSLRRPRGPAGCNPAVLWSGRACFSALTLRALHFYLATLARRAGQSRCAGCSSRADLSAQALGAGRSLQSSLTFGSCGSGGPLLRAHTEGPAFLTGHASLPRLILAFLMALKGATAFIVSHQGPGWAD
jgi:hypothetical protein